MNGATAAASSSQRRIGWTSQQRLVAAGAVDRGEAVRRDRSRTRAGRRSGPAARRPPSPMTRCDAGARPRRPRPYTERASASSASSSHGPCAVSRRCRPSRSPASARSPGRSDGCASAQRGRAHGDRRPAPAAVAARSGRSRSGARRPGRRRARGARARRRGCRRGSRRPPPRARRPAPRRPSARAEAPPTGAGTAGRERASASAMPSSGSCMPRTIGCRGDG